MVAVSGIDGSGKTTVAREIVTRLRELGCPAIYSRPKYKVCKQFEFHLYQETGVGTSFDRHPESALYASGLMIDWFTHSSDFLARNRDKIVILDRYVLDVFAQCRHFNGPSEHLAWFRRRMPTPDLEFYLDVGAEVAFQRLQQRPVSLRKFETLDQLRVLRAIYDDFIGSAFPLVARLVNVELQDTVGKIVAAVRERLAIAPLASPGLSRTRPAADICPCCDSFLYP